MKKIKQLIIIVIILINIPILANAATPIAGEKLQVKVADKNLEDDLEDDGDGDGDSESSDVEDNSYDKSKTAEAKNLNKPYTKKGQPAADEFFDIFNRLDTNNDGDLSLEELRKATTKEINILEKMNGTALAGVPKAQKEYKKQAAKIHQVYLEKCEEFGVTPDEDTTAGKEAKNDDTFVKYYDPDKEDVEGTTKGIDDMMGDANEFVSKAGNEEDQVGKVDDTALQNFSSTFYNIFLTAATAIAVITGLIIGIKYMIGSVDEKAEIKTMLVPYIVGCIVVFGSFGIWKLVIEIMKSL